MANLLRLHTKNLIIYGIIFHHVALLVCSFVCTFVVVCLTFFFRCTYFFIVLGFFFSSIKLLNIFKRSNYKTTLLFINFLHNTLYMPMWIQILILVSKEAVKNNILHLRFTYISIKIFLSQFCTKTNIFVLQKINIIKKYTAPQHFKHIIKINVFFIIQ